MTKSLVICEKSTQAAAVRAAIGNRFGQVVAAAGHILTLKEPQDVRSDWADWSAELLWPGKFYEKKPSQEKRKHLEAIRAAITGVDQVVLATDFDREGQLLGQEILDFLGFRGRVLRAKVTAVDPKSLQKAFSELTPNEQYRGLYMSGQAREQADQVSNLSLTRTGTVVMKAPGSRGAVGIGRVKSPVLAIVCKRELEILNFKPQDMFEITAVTRIAAGQIDLVCARLPKSLVKEQTAAEDEDEDDLGEDEAALADQESITDRILRKDLAEALKGAVKGFQSPLRSRAERKKQGPPKLFDMTALQVAASSRFGWGGSQTLEVAQKLYDQGLITYPRGQCRYLPENNIADVPTLLAGLLRMPAFGRHAQLLQSPQVRKGKAGHFSDKEFAGEAHEAIGPNVNKAAEFARICPTLPDDQRKLFEVIASQYLAAFAPDYEYRQTTIDMSFPWKGHSWEFRASGRVPLVPGWKAILGGVTASPDEEGELPDVKNGEIGTVIDSRLRTVTTKPPARYTEGALLKVMKEAWRLVTDPAQRARLKEAKGIGTAATSGSIVKGLLDQGQIAKTGKSIKPTPDGMKLYQVLAKVCPNVVDPARTAIWETLFDMVEQGKITAEQAVLKILDSTRKEIENIRTNGAGIQISTGKASKPSEKMLSLAKSVADRKGVKLPRGATTNAQMCRQFLDVHLPKRPEGQGGGEGFPPSEKQMAFAVRIAGAAGEQIPAEVRASSKALSAWIDARQSKMPPRPPSEKQLEFARKIAAEQKIELNGDVLKDMKACSAFIDQHMRKGGGGKAAAR